jgi:gamma-glutamyltranspeptidase/glutathione hydrolase
MGEEDLNPEGFFTLAPGTRLTSMMAPTIAFAPFERSDVPDSLLALGSAGSERLRSAIVQIIVNIVDLRLPTQEAVDRPRLHHHRGVMHAEGGTPDEVVEALRADGCEVNVWPEKDLFFGGAQVALRLSGDCDLCFEGGGDPRRGGVALIV